MIRFWNSLSSWSLTSVFGSGIGCVPFPGLAASCSDSPVDADSPWQHQTWQILAEIIWELRGTNSLISLYPVLSGLGTWKEGKVRESGKMEQDLCPLLSTLTPTLKPRCGSLSGKYVTPSPPSTVCWIPIWYETISFYRVYHTSGLQEGQYLAMISWKCTQHIIFSQNSSKWEEKVANFNKYTVCRGRHQTVSQ